MQGGRVTTGLLSTGLPCFKGLNCTVFSGDVLLCRTEETFSISIGKLPTRPQSVSQGLDISWKYLQGWKIEMELAVQSDLGFVSKL